jgi:uncharacterized protein YeaO (DUF488 family)
MILVKHLMDRVEPEDGLRLWVEPIRLTRDLRMWCHVDCLMRGLAPARVLWDWFQQHPEGYEYFRGAYHLALDCDLPRDVAKGLARLGAQRNFTLLHQGDDPEHNTATALYEYLAELQAYSPPE